MSTERFRYAPSGFFMLRAAARPVELFTGWGSALQPRPADEAGLAAALAAGRRALSGLLDDRATREALAVASATLVSDLEVWREAPESEHGQRIEAALVRYLSRMTTRPTPFGLFAGVGFGQLGKGVTLEVRGVRRRAVLNTIGAAAIARWSVEQPELQGRLRYLPNPSLAEVGGRLVFQVSHVRGDRIVHQEQEAAPSEALRLALQLAAGGAAADALAGALAPRLEVSAEEAAGFVLALAQHQLLVPELVPSANEPDPLPRLIEGLPGSPLREALRGVQSALERAELEPIRAALQALPVPLDPRGAVKFDLALESPGLVIDQQVAREVLGGVRALYGLLQPAPERRLDAFREDFARRYEEREVPLLEALDSEAGLEPQGEPVAPLLEGIPFAPPRGAGAPPLPPLLLERTLGALASGQRELVIEEGALPEPTALPEAFSAWFTLSGEEIWLQAVDGPSGVDALGRFLHLDDEAPKRARAHLEREEALEPDVSFAEVAHLPAGAADNIVTRPLLRGYELTVSGSPAAPVAQRLPLSDLLLSVRGGRLWLRSRRTGRLVMPSLSNAHEFRVDPSRVYRLLCLLRSQGCAALRWSWGALASAPFLPRVRHRSVVLCPAQWTLETKELSGRTALARHRALQRLRDAGGWPRFVALADGDLVLNVDLDNPLSTTALLTAADRSPRLTVRESHLGGESPVRGPGGRHAHELILPFVRERAPLRRPAQPGATGARTFAPGSEWSYLKLYCGSRTGDRLLLALRAALEGLGVPWFFVRFQDPDRHLRLRVRAPDALSRLQPALASALGTHGAWRLQLDTYQRELERYGGEEATELAERLFHADSELAIALLQEAAGENELEARFWLALTSVHVLLCDLGLDLARRLEVVGALRALLAGELGGGKAFEQALSQRYRGVRGQVEALVKAEAPAPYAGRSAVARDISGQLTALFARGRLPHPLEELARHYAHMTCNRLFRSSPRAQELVVYDFLARAYRSLGARAGAGA